MNPDGKGRVRLDYVIPSRGLIGFRSEFMTMTSGTGLLYSTFSHYDDVRAGDVGQRQNGVLIPTAVVKQLRSHCSACRTAVSCSRVTVLKFTKARSSVFTAALTT